MEHSICLDSEKINSIRESLEGRFNQIKIIDDSVTPKIIQWLNDFFSFLDDLKQGGFIFNKNIELVLYIYYSSNKWYYKLLVGFLCLMTFTALSWVLL